jgi:hypothetical protein
LHRTAKGAEIDLVLEKGRRRIAVECKASTSPEVTPGFWSALQDVGAQEAWIVAPIEGSYPLRKGAAVASLEACIAGLARAR